VKDSPEDWMTSVRVNVYDLTALNKILRCFHIGVYHTSVVIGEQLEYYYGFAASGHTGIDSPDHIDVLPSIMAGSFYTTIPLGMSKYTLEDCQEIAVAFKRSERWLSDYYNVLFHNCNHFSYELCQALIDQKNLTGFPHWSQRGVSIAAALYSISVGYTIGLASFNMMALGYEAPPMYPPEESSVSPEETEDFETEDLEYTSSAQSSGSLSDDLADLGSEPSTSDDSIVVTDILMVI
jgi:hypothetical protein